MLINNHLLQEAQANLIVLGCPNMTQTGCCLCDARRIVLLDYNRSIGWR
jgi:hypothetical protein